MAGRTIPPLRHWSSSSDGIWPKNLGYPIFFTILATRLRANNRKWFPKSLGPNHLIKTALDPTNEEARGLAIHLRTALDSERFRFAPLKSVPAKLDPPAPRPQPKPALQAGAGPRVSGGQRRRCIKLIPVVIDARSGDAACVVRPNRPRRCYSAAAATPDDIARRAASVSQSGASIKSAQRR